MHYPDIDREVVYYVGRPFTTERGEHQPGEVFEHPEELFYLDSFVHAGLLYPVAKDEELPWLPPHIFNALMSKERADELLNGDPSHPFEAGEKPEAVKMAEVDAKVSADLPRNTRTHAQARRKVQAKENKTVRLDEQPKPTPPTKTAS